MTKQKILIADDSEPNRLLLSFFLEELGYQVSQAENGEKAVEKALANHYSALFMDINMPLMDGLKATILLRDISFGPPIFACSAENDVEKIQHYLNSGFTDTITKPIEFNTVSHLLQKHLKVNESHCIDDVAFQEKLSQLSNRFVENVPVIINKISTALKKHSLTDLKRITHQLKGTSSQFGFEKITQISNDIESSLKKGKLDIAIHKSNFLILELKKILLLKN
jgi:CheY-like chemotaxis protein